MTNDSVYSFLSLRFSDVGTHHCLGEQARAVVVI